MENSVWEKRFYDQYVTTGQAAKGCRTDNRTGWKNENFIDAIIKKHIPKNKDIKIVDLACGNGGFINLLKKAGYYNVNGVDVSPQQVRLAHNYGLYEVIEGRIDAFLKSSAVKADVFLMIDILEHLSDHDLLETLDLVYDSLLPGGKLIAHIPNAEGLFGMRIRYGDLTHVRAFTPKSARQLLTTIGFKKITAYEDRPIPHGIISLVRRIIWELGTLRTRLLLSAETGGTDFILSQNMLVVAIK